MICAGAASCLINNQVGGLIQGAGVDNVAESIRDDSEANALLLRLDDQSLLLISCDLAGLEAATTGPMRAAIAAALGIPAETILIGGTHMHSGPSLLQTNPAKAIDVDYIEKLQSWLVGLAEAAAARLKPARLAWGTDQVRIGYNRRCCWRDGSHTMHGDATRADFTGLEGPDDPQHLALFAVDEDARPIAILQQNSSHPTCFYGANFYSADFPGASRAFLRAAVGDVPVLFFNGTFGDLAIQNQLAVGGYVETRQGRMLRAAHQITGATLRLLHEAQFGSPTVLALRHELLDVAVQLPDPARLAWARETLARWRDGEQTASMDRILAYGITRLQDEFAASAVEQIPLTAIRIGDLALFAEPCELFCQFGLDLKRRSPAPTTAVLGNVNGAIGYCPTAYGQLGGGYSGEPIHWTRLAVDAGYRIVDCGARMLRELWRA